MCRQSTCSAKRRGVGKNAESVLPVRLVVHGRHVTFLDDAVLFREVGFGEGLSVAISSAHAQPAVY